MASVKTVINSSLLTNTVIHAFGEGLIEPQQKVGKAEGPVENIGPLTLSNCIRKGQSMITLRRIREKLDTYTYWPDHARVVTRWAETVVILFFLRGRR